MSTDTLELIEIDSLLDFESECDYCDMEAKWVARHPLNGAHPLCDLHRIRLERRLQVHAMVWCRLCDGIDFFFPSDTVTIETL